MSYTAQEIFPPTARGAACLQALQRGPKVWLVTGAAGFIGSHVLEALLMLGQRVIGVDNFSTGCRENLETLRREVGAERFSNLHFVEGDICDTELIRKLSSGAEIIVHQAALGSVPRSVHDPYQSHRSNVDGFLSVLEGARCNHVRRVVYASSSSVYGDSEALPKRESDVGNLLSPYAATKAVNELYASVYQRVYGMELVGLRYFNVFGPRQDPDGPYAAVIPRWVCARLRGERCVIYGDGETSRDFCFIHNAVQANLLAAFAPPEACGRVYNIALGGQTVLRELLQHITALVGGDRSEPVFEPARPGDIRHSLASIAAAAEQLGYQPTVSVAEGLRLTVEAFRTERAAGSGLGSEGSGD